MRIVVLSDTHQFHEAINIPAGDLLVHCGDATNNGTVEEVIRFFQWFGKQSHKHKIFIPGNHDKIFETDWYSTCQLAKSVCGGNLHIESNNYLELERIKLFLYSYSLRYGDWSFMKQESEIAQDLSRVSEQVDVLITHSPPYGILDQNNDSTHCGSFSIKDLVDRITPKIHLFGHIHESSGIADRMILKGGIYQPITYINCSMSKHYKQSPLRRPFVCNLK